MDLLAGDALGEPVQHARPLPERVDDPGTDGQVVLDQVELGGADGREVHPVRVRDAHGPALHLDLDRRITRHVPTVRFSGPGRDLRTSFRFDHGVSLGRRRGRSSHATRADATSATPTATHTVELKASTKLVRATAAISAPLAPPVAAAARSASARECVASVREHPAAALSMELRNCEATRLPITATPSAPPSSRVVSFTAEPTPALCSGSERMIAPVDGAVVMPMPSAWTTTASANHQ